VDNQATYQGYENEADFRLLPETQKLMSRRTQHALLRAGYYTAEQLMMASSGELMLIKNFGKQSLIEVTQWREHLMQNDQSIYNETLQSVIEAMNATNSVTTERRAEAAMATIWRLIARSPFTATRVRQMLVVPGTADV
jgi:hypothetical protein